MLFSTSKGPHLKQYDTNVPCVTLYHDYLQEYRTVYYLGVTILRTFLSRVFFPVQGPNNLCPSTVKHNTQLDNLFVHNQFCYEFVNQKNSFFHAEYDCPKRGGTMVYIRDHSDQDFLYRMMRDLNHYGPVWLGLHDVNKEEAWEWVSGKLD